MGIRASLLSNAFGGEGGGGHGWRQALGKCRSDEGAQEHGQSLTHSTPAAALTLRGAQAAPQQLLH
jgi:hypothetical protein